MTTPRGGVNLGSAYGSIEINDNIDRALDGATQSFDAALSRIGNSISAVGSAMSNAGSAITVATAPLAGFFATGIRTASQYEDALKEIEVRAGLSAEQIAMVEEKTRDLSLSSQYGPTEVADAFLQLLTSGSSVEEAMLQIDSVIQGASASGMELGTTADALTDIMAAFGLEADQSGAVMQALAAASGSSSATMEDLVQGFANVGPMARNMGLNVDDTAAVLAVFSENGIKGAEAGTQLRSMLNNMTRPTDDVRELWDDLGISMYDARGNMRPLNDVIRDLNRSMAGMSESERNETITTLAGSYGQLGLSALLASDGFGAMAESMQGQASVQDIAASKLETFSGGLSFLQGSLELLQVTALQPLMDQYLTPLVNLIADVVNSLTEWMIANPELSAGIVAVLAGLTLLGPVLVVAGTAITALGGVVGALGGALALLMSPIGLVMAAIAALAVAWATDFGGMRATLQPVVDFIVGAASSAIDGFIGLLGSIWAEVRPALEMLANWFMVDALPAIVSILEDSVYPILLRFVNWLNELWHLTQPQLQALWDWFTVTALPAVMSFITDTVLPGIQTLIDWIGRIWTDVQPYLTSLYEWFVVTFLPGVISFLETSVFPVINSLIGLFSDIWRLVSPHLEALYNWFMVDALPAIKNFIEGPVTDAINGIIGVFGGFLDIVNDAINGVRDFLGLSGQADLNAPGMVETRDSGGRGNPGVPYLIGAGAQPELFVPDSAGTFYPNAGGAMGGSTYQISIESITAANSQEAAALGNAFGDAFINKLRNSGYAEGV
jgi:TP901 family phage tail tape measure protein